MVEPPSQLVEVTPLNWWTPPLNWWSPLSIGGSDAHSVTPPCHLLPPQTRNRSPPQNSRALQIQDLSEVEGITVLGFGQQ